MQGRCKRGHLVKVLHAGACGEVDDETPLTRGVALVQQEADKLEELFRSVQKDVRVRKSFSKKSKSDKPFAWMPLDA